MMLAAAPAFAQDAGSQLRGEISEAEVKTDLLGLPLTEQPSPLDAQSAQAQTEDGIPTPLFQPASEGAVPETVDKDDPAAKRKKAFSDRNTEAEDAKAGANGSRAQSGPAKPLKTAAEREKARKALNQPPQSASARLAAKAKKKKPGADDEAETDAETTGTVRAKTVDSEEKLKTEPDSEREEAVESLKKKPEENPYAPVGLRLGTFTVLPSAETGATWTSNADSSAGGKAATLSETTLRLFAISEFGGDKTTFDAFGNFRKSVSGEEISETRGGIKSELERDLGGDWRALASLGYEFGPESASSPDAVVGTPEQPIKHTVDGSLGVEKDVGKLQLRLTGKVEREMFGDAELSTGGSISQSDRNSTLGSVVLRTGYEISPALTPFVEGEFGRRLYDEDVDSNGFDRSSTRMAVRGGLEVDLGEKFRGEVSAGWINEDIDDSRLASISGPTAAASLDWSPVRGTAVGLDAETIVEDSTTAGDSGSILYSGTATLTHQLRANLTGELALGGGVRDYTGEDGRDTIWSAQAGMTWWLNRYVGLNGRVRHEQLDSNLPGRDYKTESVFVGLKLQR